MLKHKHYCNNKTYYEEIMTQKRHNTYLHLIIQLSIVNKKRFWQNLWVTVTYTLQTQH